VRASDVDCVVMHRLLGRWHDGRMEAEDGELYEQHLLLCPPCLVDNQRLRIALTALEAAAGGGGER
jgi:hypothetical protein